MNDQMRTTEPFTSVVDKTIAALDAGDLVAVVYMGLDGTTQFIEEHYRPDSSGKNFEFNGFCSPLDNEEPHFYETEIFTPEAVRARLIQLRDNPPHFMETYEARNLRDKVFVWWEKHLKEQG